MTSVTIDQVMQWGPCYSLTRVQELFAGRESMNVDDLLELDISARDKLWVILHPEIIPEKGLHELACIYAEEVLSRKRAAGREPHPDSWKAIAAKRAWLRGDIVDEQLQFVCHAARSAAWDAAQSARDAAWSAAGSAAGSAPWDAAWYAAWYAARSARDRSAATTEWQLQQAIAVIRREL